MKFSPWVRYARSSSTKAIRLDDSTQLALEQPLVGRQVVEHQFRDDRIDPHDLVRLVEDRECGLEPHRRDPHTFAVPRDRDQVAADVEVDRTVAPLSELADVADLDLCMREVQPAVGVPRHRGRVGGTRCSRRSRTVPDPFSRRFLTFATSSATSPATSSKARPDAIEAQPTTPAAADAATTPRSPASPPPPARGQLPLGVRPYRERFAPAHRQGRRSGQAPGPRPARAPGPGDRPPASRPAAPRPPRRPLPRQVLDLGSEDVRRGAPPRQAAPPVPPLAQLRTERDVDVLVAHPARPTEAAAGPREQRVGRTPSLGRRRRASALAMPIGRTAPARAQRARDGRRGVQIRCRAVGGASGAQRHRPVDLALVLEERDRSDAVPRPARPRSRPPTTPRRPGWRSAGRSSPDDLDLVAGRVLQPPPPRPLGGRWAGGRWRAGRGGSRQDPFDRGSTNGSLVSWKISRRPRMSTPTCASWRPSSGAARARCPSSASGRTCRT